MSLTLHPIEREGRPDDVRPSLAGLLAEILAATRALYDTVGFHKPWIGYLAFVDSELVGTCGFKSPPHDKRVEIAYFTFPDFENQGFATAMATELVATAHRADPSIIVAAQTLPRATASTRVLEKTGFRRIGTVVHPEDGEVWEWQRSTSGSRGRETVARSR